jgi:hypothetical protein
MKLNAERFLRSVFFELVITLLCFLVIRNNIKPDEPIIRADGKGYYDYLPAIFIYNDLHFGFRNQDIEKYNKNDYQGLNIPVHGGVVNKYPAGVSVFLLPGFTMAHSYCKINGIRANGYTWPYQKAVYYSAIFFLILSLFYLKKLLLLFQIPLYLACTIPILFTFGTQVYQYTFLEPAYSHLYSFFTITLFLFLFKKHVITSQFIWLYLAGTCLGLIFILRPVNIFIVLLLPLFFDSFQSFITFLKYHFSSKGYKKTIILILYSSFFVLLQCFIWFHQCGKFFVWSYGEESFDFTQPHLFDSLFSFKKGLFIYTPLIFIVMLSSFFLLIKDRYKFIIFLVWFFITLYITSSWHMWWYGMSFGLRPFVDFTGIFALIFAVSIFQIKPVLQSLFLPIISFCIYLNIIQTYQYRYFILHWDDMTAAKYWKVFLKTSDNYRGFLWENHEKNKPENYIEVKRIKLSIETNVKKLKEEGNTMFKITEFIAADFPEFKHIGIRYSVPDMNEDGMNLHVNVLDKNSNRSFSYNEFKIFHFLEKADKENKIWYIMSVDSKEIDTLKIYFELKYINHSENSKLILDEIVYFL